MVMKIINSHLNKIAELCKQHCVKSLSVFGSVLTDRFNDDSDIDFLVNSNSDINHTNYADNYFDFYYALGALLKRKIDLVDSDSIRNPYFIEELNDTKQLIYG